MKKGMSQPLIIFVLSTENNKKMCYLLFSLSKKHWFLLIENRCYNKKSLFRLVAFKIDAIKIVNCFNCLP